MPLVEAHLIAGKLGIAWDSFYEQFIDPSWPGVKTLLLKHQDGQCVFLERQADKRVFFCRIQSFKPVSCIDWNADLVKQDCQEGLRQFWGLKATLGGVIEGTESSKEAFSVFLSRLRSDSTVFKHNRS
ncbi:hypothetical protein DGWBC_0544 [Dehalogenimonas sp. WBC-2]|nr:hypothetical protein DGWBC_0544 [Dehalogenimonas sp. WBC-2]